MQTRTIRGYGWVVALSNSTQNFAHNKQEDTKRLSHCVEEAQDEVSDLMNALRKEDNAY